MLIEEAIKKYTASEIEIDPGGKYLALKSLNEKINEIVNKILKESIKKDEFCLKGLRKDLRKHFT